MTIEAYYQDNFATQYNGHVLDILPHLKPESIQCCVTSPPYWGLRDYGLPPQIWDDPGGCEHEWGDNLPPRGQSGWHTFEHKYHSPGSHKTTIGSTMKEIEQNKGHGSFCQLCGAWRGSLGLEPNPELYIQHVVQVFREVKRVLRKDGTCFLNMGDSYAGSGKGDGGHTRKQTTNTGSQFQSNLQGCVPRGLKPKDLCMIPARVALALQQDGWWLRSDIIWNKPNPMPESVTDRPTRSHEYVFLLTKSAKYFYDADAVREPHKYPDDTNRSRKERGTGSKTISSIDSKMRILNAAGRNLRSVWTIATEPTPEAHFATFPEKLVIPCIKAGTSEKGCCPECGAPWVRVVEKGGGSTGKGWNDHTEDLKQGQRATDPASKGGHGYYSKTIGWKPSCECSILDYASGRPVKSYPVPIPCTVLDSFSGSGKVLLVAKKLFRKAIGIELNAEYCEMPVKKLKPGRLAF